MGYYEDTRAAWEKMEGKSLYAEKDFDRKIDEKLAEYYSSSNKGRVTEADVVSTAASNMAMDVCPFGWFLFLREPPANMPNYWKDQISLKNLQKMHFLVAKALACGYADNAYDAVEWAKKHK